MSKNFPKHLKLLIDNISEVEQLLAMQDAPTGITRRRYNVETLNASCIVLLVACWESYIEDVVGAAFDVLLNNAKTPLNIPLVNYKNKQLRSFNTPNSENIDTLCDTLLNIQKISKKFNVPRKINSDVREQLDSLIILRGSIAHRVKANKPISQ